MEKWKRIRRGNGNYEVSTLGRVRNKKTKRLLSVNPTKSHRSPQVFLQMWKEHCLWNGQSMTYYVKHQLTVSNLVWDAFGSVKRAENEMVLHKDGNVENNRIENLTLSKRAMKKGDKRQ